MDICRQCFREKSSDIGFHKVRDTISFPSYRPTDYFRDGSSARQVEHSEPRLTRRTVPLSNENHVHLLNPSSIPSRLLHVEFTRHSRS